MSHIEGVDESDAVVAGSVAVDVVAGEDDGVESAVVTGIVVAVAVVDW